MQHDLKRKFRDIKQDAEGNFSFTGSVYRLAGDNAEVKSAQLRLTGGIVLLAACVIGSGCIDAAGASDAFYVILPFIGEVSALFVLCWNMAKLIPGIFARDGADRGFGVRDYVFEKVGGRISGACTLLAVFATMGLVLSIVYITKNGTGNEAAKSICYMLLKISAACISLWYRRQFAALIWEEIAK